MAATIMMSHCVTENGLAGEFMGAIYGIAHLRGQVLYTCSYQTKVSLLAQYQCPTDPGTETEYKALLAPRETRRLESGTVRDHPVERHTGCPTSGGPDGK